LISLFGLFLSFIIYYQFALNNYHKMLSIAVKLSKFIVLFGGIQLCTFFVDAPIFYDSIYFLTKIFSQSEQVINNRIRLFSHEPSWAATQLLVFVIPFLYYQLSINNTKLNKFYLLLAFALLIYTKSALAIIYVVGLVMWLGMRYLILFILTFRIKPIIFTVLLIPLLFLNDFFLNLFAYQFSKINIIIDNGLFLESSTASRIGNFITGLLVFTDHPFLGVGLGQFGFYYPDYVPVEFLNSGEAKSWSDPSSSYFATTKSFPVKLLAEIGIIGFILFYSLFLKLIISLKSLHSDEARAYKLALYGIFIWSLNSDSFMQLYIWFVFAMAFSFIHRHSLLK